MSCQISSSRKGFFTSQIKAEDNSILLEKNYFKNIFRVKEVNKKEHASDAIDGTHKNNDENVINHQQKDKVNIIERKQTQHNL